jgi:(+)-trans-carveol dehydrogenase
LQCWSSTFAAPEAPNLAHYAAAKHGVVGLMRTLANELAPDMVRVNTGHPSSVDNDMIHTRRRTASSCPTIRARSPERRPRRYSRR